MIDVSQSGSYRDPDAWIAKPQPTPELCRLYHGVDCRRCVNGFALADKLVTIEAHWRADQWRRDADERAKLVQAWNRATGAAARTAQRSLPLGGGGGE